MWPVYVCWGWAENFEHGVDSVCDPPASTCDFSQWDIAKSEPQNFTLNGEKDHLTIQGNN